MTTPAERAVLGAVLRWHRADKPNRAAALAELTAAATLLETEFEAPTMERELTFGQLVTGDHIQSANGKWYEVQRTGRVDDSAVKVWLRGVPKPLEKYTGQTVAVRRSALGDAVDVFASVLWSGPTGRETAA